MNPHLSVVISRGNSRNPSKLQLEQDILTTLTANTQLRVVVVPHLNDLRHDGSAVRALRALQGDLVLISWLFPRAAYWMLDSFGIEGRLAGTHLDRETPHNDVEAEKSSTVLEMRELPDRVIYCLDLRSQDSSEEFVEAVNRIAVTQQSMSDPQASRHPPEIVEELTQRRWYPVIDYGRCTNCMECVDFCLFGVYGLDETDTILVEEPDNCRKGCPACSRVCPESAIMFPQHATPAIAGAAVGTGSLKVDLSKLFGAPEEQDSQRELAARERESHLQRSQGSQADRDDLDKLIDELDDLDL
jgi:NAD-dependent dihydropyrimidine dehydrogenase PreA subunit